VFLKAVLRNSTTRSVAAKWLCYLESCVAEGTIATEEKGGICGGAANATN
jgi:hypothetical protein